MENIFSSNLDNEWERLMEEARQLGLTPEDVRSFLTDKKQARKDMFLEANKGIIL